MAVRESQSLVPMLMAMVMIVIVIVMVERVIVLRLTMSVVCCMFGVDV
jgi:hypothetical protein